METIERFIPYYSSVHRGTGFKSRLSTTAYEQAHEIIARFVGPTASADRHIGKNTTEAINKLSYRLGLQPDDVVITTWLEHHSNDLPGATGCRVVTSGPHPKGGSTRTISIPSCRSRRPRTNRRHVGGVERDRLPAADSPAGRKTHEAGALFLADCAQLAAHAPST